MAPHETTFFEPAGEVKHGDEMGPHEGVEENGGKAYELWLFTTAFPFGKGEAFLENELPTLVRRFGRVRVFPMLREEGLRPLPEGAELTVLFKDPYAGAGLVSLLRNAGAVLRMVASLWHDMGGMALRAEWRGQLASRIRQSIRRMVVWERELLPGFDPRRVLLYAYWTHDWATLLALLRTRHPRSCFVARAHGFDLYEHQHASGVIPFRSLHLRQVERLFCVSQAGLEHMRTRHPGYADKLELARLGTRDHGLNGPLDRSRLQVVSCSHVIPRKRVHLIAEALAKVAVPVRWTHFGDGPGMTALRDLVARLPAHVQVDLRGAAANADIMRWYRTNGADVFVLTSHLEGGVAVVLQEAASFGIPLIATDSGGVRDIVTPATGVLLPTDAGPDVLASQLQHFRTGPMATAEFRAGVRRFWETHFRAEESFGRFCDRIIAMHEARRLR